MNYIQQTKHELQKHMECEDDLVDLYNLLVWVLGESTTWEDVHNAWSVWQNKTNPSHKSLVPFDELSEETQKLDAEYANAIKTVAKQFNPSPF